MTAASIRLANPGDLAPALPELTEILHQSVHAGASVGFILPFSHSDAEAFWLDQVFPAVATAQTVLFLAQQDQEIIGTVQLSFARPANQPHRADVAKLLVHPKARRQGIARQLMRALETEARQNGKTLLVLDTRSGDSAQPLYASLGFAVAGEIPGYCRNPFTDTYEGTTYMYKALR
ncbi:MAG: GNAT family N-acetyltransferase [Aestuariivita sp.]|uniref:GNAT family N-acetyltransferase n=1 Tax=Aestuariivita sp. TaxID=1872407 RepID=UPI003BB0C38E